MNRFRICASIVALAILVQPRPAGAQDDFRALAARLPRDANTVVILNFAQAKLSALGKQQQWAERMEKAFEGGLTRVPPKTKSLVLAAQLDFTTLAPLWQAAVLAIDDDINLPALAKARGGEMDKLGSQSAVALPSGAYVVRFDARTVRALAPANRQAALRWMQEIGPMSSSQLSPYLQKAAGYSDDAQTDIIMAIDLTGAFSSERVAKYLGNKAWLDEVKASRTTLSNLLAGIQGLRLGIRIGEKPYGKVVVDFSDDTSSMKGYAKRFLTEVLAEAGAMIDDVEQWKEQVSGTKIALEGYLSPEGMRRVLSLVQSPVPDRDVGAEIPAPKSTQDVVDIGAKSKEHFNKVTTYLRDLKLQMPEVKTFASTAVWFDRYASKIEKLPLLNVDSTVLDYSAFVVKSLRDASGSVRMAGIRGGVRKCRCRVPVLRATWATTMDMATAMVATVTSGGAIRMRA